MAMIEIAKKDITPLRNLLYEKFNGVRYCPARRAGATWLDPQLELLAKTIRKLNRAAKQAHGHDCHASVFDLNYWETSDDN